MRDIDIGLQCRVIDIVDEPHHVLDVAQQGQRKRFEFQGDFESQVLSVLGQFPAVVDTGFPLLRWRDHLLVPDVLAEHQQQVVGLVLVTEVQERVAAVHVEALDGGIEIDQANGDTADRDDWQTGLVALGLDQSSLPGCRCPVDR